MSTAKATPIIAPQPEPGIDPQQMHAADEYWRNEGALWHEELKLWQDELKLARTELAEVLVSLDEHETKLRQHAALTLYGREAAEHEHALAKFERGGQGETLLGLAQAHRTEAERHARVAPCTSSSNACIIRSSPAAPCCTLRPPEGDVLCECGIAVRLAQPSSS